MAKVRLGDIATVVTKGTTPTTIGFQFEDSGINFVKIESISEDGTFLKEKFSHISNECNVQMRRSQLQENDILFSIAGAIGRSVIVTKEILPANTNQALAIIRVPKGKIDYNYLLYALSSSAINQQATQHQQGVAQLNISLKNVSDFLLPIYTEAMQKRIVQNLKKIDKLVFLRKQQLAKLDELVKARFVEMFGDPVNNPMNYPKSQLGKVCDVRDGTHDSPEYYDVGYPLVTSKNVTGGKIDLSECNLISEDDYKKICERSKVDRGDIIMPMIGTVGKPVIVNAEPMFAIKNVALIKFTPDSLVTNIYIETLLESDYFDRAVLDKIRGGTQKFIALGDIRKLEIILPDLKHQQCFSAFVERVDKQKQTVQQSLEKLELMKKALMQEYFG